MKSPSKLRLLVATLVIGIGVCGGGWLLRGPILRSGIDGFLQRLQARGLGTQLGTLRWEGLWTARIDRLVVTGGEGARATVTDMELHLQPAFSLRGSEWIRSVSVGNIAVKAGMFQGQTSLEALNTPTGFGIALHDTWVQHPKYGNDTLQLGELAGWCRVESAGGRVALRPGSCLQWGEVWVAANGHWDGVEDSFALQGFLPLQAAQAVMNPLAAAAPAWLGGMQLQGAAQGYLELGGDLDKLENLTLGGDLDGQGIVVGQYGAAHLDSLKAVLRDPALMALDAMPQYLVQAVVLSEDAGFWDHRGFDAEIVRLALVENIAERKFLRGGGTIPMQLVRNMFLHHGKQLDRKLAEVVLTWLAEEQHILTKEEQMTLYLNVIEWGDGIHGIRQAAAHYFGKTPQALTADEAILLACIIPNPRHAAALFENDGSLGPYARDYFDSMRWMLYEGDWIGEQWLEAPYPTQRSLKNTTLVPPKMLSGLELACHSRYF